MAEVSEKVITKGYKLVSINDFRMKYANGISTQAMDYAITKDLIDYVYIGAKVRAIALTRKTLAYTPNKSKTRKSRMKL